MTDDLLTQALDYIAALEAAGNDLYRATDADLFRAVVGWNETRANKPHELVLACEERKGRNDG